MNKEQGKSEILYNEIPREYLKKVATSFFYYWWNEKGNNTEDGFDSFAETKEGKELLSISSQPSTGMPPEELKTFIADQIMRRNNKDATDNIYAAFCRLWQQALSPSPLNDEKWITT